MSKRLKCSLTLKPFLKIELYLKKTKRHIASNVICLFCFIQFLFKKNTAQPIILHFVKHFSCIMRMKLLYLLPFAHFYI
jgi:hypothetical protein